jgi:hypothetical protein
MTLEKMEEEIPNGWDEHFCFNIIDFTPGSAIIVKKGKSKERGVVVSTDNKKFIISYRNANGDINSVNINSIVLLQDGSREWLSKPL